MVSQYVNPHQFTAAAAAYSDNVDLSIDKFPLCVGKEETNEFSKFSFCPRYSKENSTVFEKGRCRNQLWLEVFKIMSRCDTVISTVEGVNLIQLNTAFSDSPSLRDELPDQACIYPMKTTNPALKQLIPLLSSLTFVGNSNNLASLKF